MMDLFFVLCLFIFLPYVQKYEWHLSVKNLGL